MSAVPAPRTCARCGLTETGDADGAEFTTRVYPGQHTERYDPYCDACRARVGRQRAEQPVDRETAARFLALAAEYAGLARRADDPVYARRLARAANDYRRMAARGR